MKEFNIVLSKVPQFYSLVLSGKAMKNLNRMSSMKEWGKCALMQVKCGFSGSQACNRVNFSKQRFKNNSNDEPVA